MFLLRLGWKTGYGYGNKARTSLKYSEYDG